MLRPILVLLAASAWAADIRVSVEFGKHLRDWDGFGVNYVEASQTRDYQADPQEYGGFSLLEEAERQQILEMIFGPDGLKPGLLKMFLDPFHEKENDNSDPNAIDASRFDHATTTRWMRYFVREGLRKTRARGGDLNIVTTLYGPPAWTTRQRIVRGRDLDPDQKYEVAEYLIAWAKYLRETEQLPLKYVSLHNEGEDYVRWSDEGGEPPRPGHDYNMYWPAEQVADFISFLRPMLDKQGLRDVGITPGETSNWSRFHEWGYAQAIADHPGAMRNLGLITSHGFVGFNAGRWFGDWRSTGNDILRERNPNLHSWVTSQSWGRTDADARRVNLNHFLNVIRGNIYVAKVNGIIPWAAIQRPAKWVGGDPNAGKAFGVDEQGSFTIEPGYYYLKQVCRAGQPGMAVAHVVSLDPEVGLIAFSRNRTKHPDAFVVLNLSNSPKPLVIGIQGTDARAFEGFRTSETERYISIGRSVVASGAFRYTAPPGSATTFFAH
jgi:hypothetical protein